MKKMLMMAASLLILAGAMISCNGNGVNPTKSESALRTKAIHEMIYGKTADEAAKTLEAAGYTAMPMPEMMPAKAQAKFEAAKASLKIKKAASAPEEVIYIKEVVKDQKYELVYFTSNNNKGTIDYYQIMWEYANEGIVVETGVKQIKEMALYCYAETKAAYFYGFIANDRNQKDYMESEALQEEINAAKEQIEKLYKSGELSKEEYKEALAEIDAELEELGSHATFVKDLDAKFENFLAVEAQYVDGAAMKTGKGVVAALMADIEPEEGMFILYEHYEGEIDFE